MAVPVPAVVNVNEDVALIAPAPKRIPTGTAKVRVLVPVRFPVPPKTGVVTEKESEDVPDIAPEATVFVIHAIVLLRLRGRRFHRVTNCAIA